MPATFLLADGQVKWPRKTWQGVCTILNCTTVDCAKQCRPDKQRCSSGVRKNCLVPTLPKVIKI